MNTLKGLGLGILSFLLFLSLFIFGFALMLNTTVLSPKFITSAINELDVSSMAEEILSEQSSEGEFQTALVDTLANLEPSVKEQISAATYSIYDYLLGKKESPELALTLRNTLLNSDFFTALITELDIASLANEFLTAQLAENLPQELEYLVVKYGHDTISAVEPWIKQQLIAAADPLSDYLLGESENLNIVIPLDAIKEDIEDALKESFLKSPPPELAHLPQNALEQYFNENFGGLAQVIPSGFQLDESVIGTELPAEIAKALTEAEAALEQARPAISYFQLGYKLLIGFIVLLILGIIFINRRVKTITLVLGIIFTICGALQFASTFIAKSFATAQTIPPDTPTQLRVWLPQLISDSLSPLRIFSICILVVGVALIIVSFVYKPHQTQFEE